MIRKPVEDADEATSSELRNSRQSSRESSIYSSLSDLLASESDDEPEGEEERAVRVSAVTGEARAHVGSEAPSTTAAERFKCEGRRVAALLRHLVDGLSTETAQTPAMVT